MIAMARIANVFSKVRFSMLKAFYTHVSCHEGYIIHRFIDETGERRIERVSHDFSYYLPKHDGEHTSLYGTKLTRLTTNSSIELKKKFREQPENFHGMHHADIQFINDKYKSEVNHDFKHLKIGSIDIETAIGEGFPIPERAEQEIIAITVQTIGSNITHTFTTCDYRKEHDTEYSDNNVVHVLPNEYQLLHTFIRFWFKEKYDAITGWNCVPLTNTLWLPNRIARMRDVKREQELYNSKIRRVFPITTKKVWATRLANGRIIESSSDHIFPIWNSQNVYAERAVSEIREMIKSQPVYVEQVLNRNTNEPLTWGHLIKTQISWLHERDIVVSSTNDITLTVVSEKYQPLTFASHEIISDETLWFLGWWFGHAGVDGSLAQHWNDDVVNRLRGHLGYDTEKFHSSHYWFEQLFIVDGNTKKLNVEWLSMLSRNQFLAFLAGVVDTRGSNHHGAIFLDDIRLHYVQDLSELLQWNGIFSSVSTFHLKFTCTDEHFISNVMMKDIVADQEHTWSDIYSSENRLQVIDIYETDKTVDMIDIETSTHLFISQGITTHNCKSFDIPYIIKRSEAIIGESSTRFISPIAHMIKRGYYEDRNPNNDELQYKIDGMVILDYLELYKKYSFTSQPNYKLETIAQYELNEGKVDYCGYSTLKEFYQNNPTMFIRYNIQDVLLVDKLESTLNFILLSYTLQYLAKCNTQDIFGQVKFWDCLIYSHLQSKGLITPPPNDDSDEFELEGAYVADPVLGKHRWVGSFDLTSLYPMTIKQYNMSPETIVRKSHRRDGLMEELINLQDNNELQYARKHNLALAANGAMFRTDTLGIFSEVINKLFAIRKETRAKMKELQRQGHADVRHLDAIQMAMKIAINSLYGACGNQGFRYFNPSIAEAITQSGQLAIRHIGKKLDEFLNELFKTDTSRWIYTDTDSIYFTFETFIDRIDNGKVDPYKLAHILSQFLQEVVEPFIDKSYNALAIHMNAYENAMSMKRETISLAGMWRAKKNYALLEIDNEGVIYNPMKVKTIGIETVRSTTPQFVKDALLKCYRIMLTETDKNALLGVVNQFHREYLQSDYNNISTPRGVNDIKKWLEADNKTCRSGTPFHVRASVDYNNLRAKHNLKDLPIITDGSKVNIVKLKPNNITSGGYIAYVNNIPDEFGLKEYIDYEGLYVSTFLNPLDSFAKLLSMKLVDEFDIDDFFN